MFSRAMTQRTADFIRRLWAKDQDAVNLYNAIGPLSETEANEALRKSML